MALPQRNQVGPQDPSKNRTQPSWIAGARPLGHRRIRPDRRQYGDPLSESKVDHRKGVTAQIEAPEQLIVRGLGVDRNTNRLLDRPPFQKIHRARIPSYHAVRHRTGIRHDDS